MPAQLIVALDFNDETSALTLVDQLDPGHCALKVGSEMYTLLGPSFIRQLVANGFKVFLDLKFHDIPNTVAQACKAGADLGVWMLNVHAAGGLAMMRAARSALDAYGDSRPLLIAVTVLTSMDDEALRGVGVDRTLPEQVAGLARLSKQAGLDGVVCSASETPLIKMSCGTQFLAITPGIRFNNDNKDDQTRIMTPEQAIKAGSDYLVIGRPITHAANPVGVVNSILQLLNK